MSEVARSHLGATGVVDANKQDAGLVSHGHTLVVDSAVVAERLVKREERK